MFWFSVSGMNPAQIFAWIQTWNRAKDSQDPCEIYTTAAMEMCENAPLRASHILLYLHIGYRETHIQFKLVWSLRKFFGVSPTTALDLHEIPSAFMGH